MGEASQASASLLTALSLFSFTQQNRTFAFQSRYRWLPPPLPRPHRQASAGRSASQVAAGWGLQEVVIWQGCSRTGEGLPLAGPTRPGPPGSLWYLRKQMQSRLRQAPYRAWHRPARSPEDQAVQQASPWPQACIRPAGRHLPRGSGLLPARAPRSLLVVIGGVGKGELQAVGLGQQQADVPVTPVGCGQVLQEEQQLLEERDRPSQRKRQRRAAGLRGCRPGRTWPAAWVGGCDELRGRLASPAPPSSSPAVGSPLVLPTGPGPAARRMPRLRRRTAGVLGAVPPQHFTAVTPLTDTPAPRAQEPRPRPLTGGSTDRKEAAIPGRLQAQISVHLVTLQQ